MSADANSQNTNLPLVLFGALLQTGAGMALTAGSAIALSPTSESTRIAPVTAASEQTPKLILQSDGSVVPQDQALSSSNSLSSISQHDNQSKGEWKLVVSEDGTVSIQPEATAQSIDTDLAEEAMMEDEATDETMAEEGASEAQMTEAQMTEAEMPEAEMTEAEMTEAETLDSEEASIDVLDELYIDS